MKKNICFILMLICMLIVKNFCIAYERTDEVITTGNKVLSEAQFKDLSKEHWAYESIMVLVQNGVINGYEDTTFRPEQEVSREEFMKMMYSVIENEEYVGGYENYIDVDKNRWSYNSINFLGSALVDSDEGNSCFYPTKILSRKEMAKIIVMIKELHGIDYTDEEKNSKKKYYGHINSEYIDLLGVEEYIPYIYAAINSGFMNGISVNKFSPNGSVTRAQAATLIKRIYYPYEKYTEEQLPQNDSVRITSNQIEKFLNQNNISSWYEIKIGDNIINLYKESLTCCVLYFEESDDINSYSRYLNSKSLREAVHYDQIGQINLYGKIFGFNVELSSDIKTVTLKKEINGINYFIETQAIHPSYYDDAPVYDMIFFIINNAENLDYVTINEMKILDTYNIFEELRKKYEVNKKYYYGIYNEATIEFDSENQMIISYVNKSDENVKDVFNPYNTVPKRIGYSKIEEYKNIFGIENIGESYEYFKVVSGDVPYVKKMISGNRETARDIDIYGLIAYILIQNPMKSNQVELESEKYKYVLDFDDIILSKPLNQYNSEGYAWVEILNFVFDRNIKSIDVDVLNSYNESVMCYAEFKSVMNEKKTDKVYKLNVLAALKPGEAYTVIMKNAVDYEGQATPKEKKYTFSFTTLGSKIKKTGKDFKITINVPKNITKESIIIIDFEGDLQANHSVAYKLEKLEETSSTRYWWVC